MTQTGERPSGSDTAALSTKTPTLVYFAWKWTVVATCTITPTR